MRNSILKSLTIVFLLLLNLVSYAQVQYTVKIGGVLMIVMGLIHGERGAQCAAKRCSTVHFRS